MLPFKLILWSHSKLSVQNSSTQQDTGISKHSGWRQMFAGTIRCLLFPFFFFFLLLFFFFLFWSILMQPSVINHQEPRKRIKRHLLIRLFTALQKTVGDLCHWMDAVSLGIKSQWGRSHARREEGNGQNEITTNNMLQRRMHKQLHDPQRQSTSR